MVLASEGRVMGKPAKPVPGLNFGQALELLKEGARVTRDGWNGKGMFLHLESSSHEGSSAWEPFIVLHTAQSTLVPWTPSQTDVLAEDWWRAL